MEKINLNYSLKNIPTPDKKNYELALIDKIEAVIRRMRWKLFWINNESDNSKTETFGFKSRSTPPFQRELERFENDVFDIVTNLKYRKTYDPFQQEMHNDLKTSKILITSTYLLIKPQTFTRCQLKHTRSYLKIT